jgi:hypothetical protein
MRRAFCALALALSAVVAGAGTTFASSLRVVSGPSPYADCTVGAAGPSSKNFPSAEVEPFIATNTTFPFNVLGAWQQDRWNDGGAHGLAAGVSFDGGRTFKEGTLPFSTCAPGGVDYERASDPGVSFDRTGIAYAIGLPFDGSTNRNGVAVARSLNGGQTWVDTQMLIRDVGDPVTGNPSDDKELVFADPTRPFTAYAVWGRYMDVPGTAATRSLTPSRPRPNQARRAAAPALPAVTVPIYFSRTRDGGKTWERARPILQTAPNEGTGANYMVVDPRKGTLYDFFDLSTADNKDRLSFIRSNDGGDTWGPVETITDIQSVGANDPVTGEHARVGANLPIPAIDPRTGHLYVVWEDSRLNGGTYDEVLITDSTDRGQTWSTPTRVSTPTGRPAFTPTVAVTQDGTVGVTYYDYRFLPAGDTTTLPTDTWLKKAGAGTVSFGPDIHVAPSFDMLTAPYVDTRGHFVGDYEGLTTVGRQFHPLFVRTNRSPTDLTDVFTGSF